MFWVWKIFVAFGALLVLQSAYALVDGFRFLGLIRRRLEKPLAPDLPPTTILIPCKGVDAGFEANVEAFLRQEYPDYRIVFIVASGSDPAYLKLKRCLEALAGPSKSRATLVVAGIADGRGEKVHNLLRGLEAVDPATTVLVFADIDAAPHADWLRSLVTRLHDPQVTVSTGFRWYLPGKGFASLLRAAWDTSIATMLGEGGVKFAWGGSMAIRAADFRRLRVAEDYWAGSVSDDYGLTRAVNDAKEKIAFEPKCLVASREDSGLREFLSWSTRQIIITRVYASHLWKLGLAASILYCATFVMGFALLILRGSSAPHSFVVGAILLVVLILGGAKGYIRAIVAREMFPAELGNRSPSCYWLLSPLVPWVMLGNFLVAGFTRRIEWRGTVYELISPHRVRVVKRSTVHGADQGERQSSRLV